MFFCTVAFLNNSNSFHGSPQINGQCSCFQNIELLKSRPAHLAVLLHHVVSQFDPAALVRCSRIVSLAKICRLNQSVSGSPYSCVALPTTLLDWQGEKYRSFAGMRVFQIKEEKSEENSLYYTQLFTNKYLTLKAFNSSLR